MALVTREGLLLVLNDAIDACREGKLQDTHTEPDFVNLHDGELALDINVDLQQSKKDKPIFFIEISAFYDVENETSMEGDDVNFSEWCEKKYNSDDGSWQHSFSELNKVTLDIILQHVHQIQNIRSCHGCGNMFSSSFRELCRSCILTSNTGKDIDSVREECTCSVCLEKVTPVKSCPLCSCVLHRCCFEQMTQKGMPNCPQCKHPMKGIKK
jgi:hypothetical protein